MSENLTKVLVIDEEKKFLDEAKAELSTSFQVETCSTGKEGLAIFKNFNPNVVIVDNKLSDVSFTKFINRSANFMPNY